MLSKSKFNKNLKKTVLISKKKLEIKLFDLGESLFNLK